MKYAIAWSAREKYETEYEIPISATNIAVELCDRIIFTDAIFTNGIARGGWVELIEVDTKKNVIKLKVILEPYDDVTTTGDIIESGSQPNLITESGSRTDTYTEDGA